MAVCGWGTSPVAPRPLEEDIRGGMIGKNAGEGPRTEMTLPLMNEVKSLLQSWGRHVLEDLRGRFLEAAWILPRWKEVSGNSLGSVLCLRGSKRHYLSTIPVLIKKV